MSEISVQVAPFDFPGAFSPWDVFPSVFAHLCSKSKGLQTMMLLFWILFFISFHFLVVSFSRSVNHTGVSQSALFCSRLLNVDFILNFLIIKLRFFSRLSFRRIFHPIT